MFAIVTEECYTFTDHGHETIIATGPLRRMIEGTNRLLGNPRGGVFEVPINDDWAKAIREKGGVEELRLQRALKTKKYKHMLYLEWNDNYILADGNHTYLARHTKGHKWAPAYVVPEIIWRTFIVERKNADRNKQ